MHRILPAAPASLAALALTASLVTTGAPALAQNTCAKVAHTVLARGKPFGTAAKPVPIAQLQPSLTDFGAFRDYLVKMRGDDPQFLAQRWQRYLAMVRNRDLRDDKSKRAFLLTPREEFARRSLAQNPYAHAWMGIGCGVTISGPHIVGRMTHELDVKPGEKVLEIGTGSGYQSAILRALTDKVYTIEIIPPLAAATNRIYGALGNGKYAYYKDIKRKTADGYFGWKEHAPFDKIIVTAGIDHVPQPLIRQLKVGGTMVIPVGPPGRQALLKITKIKRPSGRVATRRVDIYASDPSRAGGRRKTKVSFVAFTKYDAKGCASSRWDKKFKDRRKYGCK
jgi:protein-L-isoaspartate(D-aspartate) O-methyltransferase